MSRLWWSVLAAIAAAGAALRLWGIERKWLWWDELLSANFAYGDWYSPIAEALRFDPHPPFYYLQLHLWMALRGTSDLWLMLNSVAWSVAGIVGVGWVARRLYDGPAGWLAAALYAVLAGSIHSAVQVRMYSMIPTLAVWCFWFHRRSARGEGGRLAHLGALAAEAAIAFSHGSGFLMLSGLYGYGLWESARSGHWRAWLRWRAFSTAMLTPCLVFAVMRRNDFTHPVAPGFAEIGRGLQWLVVNAPDDSVWVWAAAGVWTACFWLAFRDRASRMIALSGVLLPIALYALVSHFVRPVWVPRNLSVVLPFFCLAAAGGASVLPRFRARTVACAVVAVLALAGALGQSRAQKGDDFKPAAELTLKLTQPGDLVIFYGSPLDWYCFSWYHRGPAWGDPLADHTFRMGLPQLTQRFSTALTRRFLLHEEVREWRAGGARITTEFNGPEGVADALRVVRVISAPRFSPLHDRRLPPVEGRSLLHSEALTQGDLRLEIWR